MTYANVVVGTDGSPTAETAVAHAARLAATERARLLVVTAYTAGAAEPGVTVDAVPDDLRWVLTDRAQAEELAARGKARAKAEGVEKVMVQASEGDPGEVLIEAAKAAHADVIVVGSKGLTGAARFVLGSVASTVAHHAPCDVLVVHTV